VLRRIVFHRIHQDKFFFLLQEGRPTLGRKGTTLIPSSAAKKKKNERRRKGVFSPTSLNFESKGPYSSSRQPSNLWSTHTFEMSEMRKKDPARLAAGW